MRTHLWLRALLALTMVNLLPARAGSAGEGATAALTDPLQLRVQVPDIRNGVLALAVLETARHIPVPVHLELERRRAEGSWMKAESPGYAVAAGEYTVLELLERLRRAVPSLKWTATPRRVHLRVPHRDGYENVLDRRVRQSREGRMTFDQLSGWVSRMHEGVTLGTWDGLFPEPGESVAMTVPAGATVRDVLDQFAEGLDLAWIATVRDDARPEALPGDNSARPMYIPIRVDVMFRKARFVPVAAQPGGKGGRGK